MTQTIYVTVAIGDEFNQLELTVLTGGSIDKLFSRINLAIAREFDPDTDAVHILMNDPIEDRKEVNA